MERKLQFLKKRISLIKKSLKLKKIKIVKKKDLSLNIEKKRKIISRTTIHSQRTDKTSVLERLKYNLRSNVIPTEKIKNKTTYILGKEATGNLTLGVINSKKNQRKKILRSRKNGEEIQIEALRSDSMQMGASSKGFYEEYQNRSFAQKKLYSRSFEVKRKGELPKNGYKVYGRFKNPDILLKGSGIKLR